MKKILVIGCLMMACVPTMAQGVGDSSILTFQDAVKIALMNNVTLQTQRNQLELSQVQKRSAIASVGPNVSLNGSATQINGNSFNQQQGRVTNGIRDNVSGAINADLNLFSGFGQLNTIRQNIAAFDAQQFFVERTAQDVISLVGTQYLNVLLDIELMRIAKENFEVQKTQLAQIHEFVEVGSRATVDEYNQDALTKAAELRYVQAEILLTNDMAILTQTLLIDPFENYAVRKPNWDINTIGSEPVEIERMLTLAKEHRGDYKRAVRNEAAQRYGAMAAKSLMLPSLSAFFNYGSNYNFQHNVPDSVQNTYRNLVPFNPSPGVTVYGFTDEISETVANSDVARPFSEQFRTNNVYKSYGLQLTIPLFRGLRNRVQYVQQRVARDNAVLQTKNAEFQLKNDVLRTVRNFEGVKKAYQVTVDQLRAAELAFQYESERYNLGVTNLVEYSTANARYVQALTDKAAAEYRLLFQKIQLEYSLGTLKIEDLQ
jgi:outer membrane protein